MSAVNISWQFMRDANGVAFLRIIYSQQKEGETVGTSIDHSKKDIIKLVEIMSKMPDLFDKFEEYTAVKKGVTDVNINELDS
jgi:hypothetical protein